MEMTDSAGGVTTVTMPRRGAQRSEAEASLPADVIVVSDDAGFAVVKNTKDALCVRELRDDDVEVVNLMKGLGFSPFVVLNRFDGDDAADKEYWDVMETMVYARDESGDLDMARTTATMACLVWNRALKLGVNENRSHTAVEKLTSMLYTDVQKIHATVQAEVDSMAPKKGDWKCKGERYDACVAELTCPRQRFGTRADRESDWSLREETNWLVRVAPSGAVWRRCSQAELLNDVLTSGTTEFAKLGPWEYVVHMFRNLAHGAESAGVVQQGGDSLEHDCAAVADGLDAAACGSSTVDLSAAKALLFKCFVGATLDVMRTRELGAAVAEGKHVCATLCRGGSRLLQCIRAAEQRAAAHTPRSPSLKQANLRGWWQGMDALGSDESILGLPSVGTASDAPQVARGNPAPTTGASKEPRKRAPANRKAPRPPAKDGKASKVPLVQSMCLGNCIQATVMIVSLAMDLYRPSSEHRQVRCKQILDITFATNVPNQKVCVHLGQLLKSALEEATWLGDAEDPSSVLAAETRHYKECFYALLSKNPVPSAPPAPELLRDVASKLNHLCNTIAVFKQGQHARDGTRVDAAEVADCRAFALLYASVVSLLAGQRKPPRLIRGDRLAFLTHYEILTAYVLARGLDEGLKQLEQEALAEPVPDPAPEPPPCPPEAPPPPTDEEDAPIVAVDDAVPPVAPAAEPAATPKVKKRKRKKNTAESSAPPEVHPPSVQAAGTEDPAVEAKPKKKRKKKKKQAVAEAGCDGGPPRSPES